MSRPTFTGFEKASDEAASQDAHDDSDQHGPADAYVDTWYQVLKARADEDPDTE